MAVRLLYLIFRQLIAWLGLLARGTQSKNAIQEHFVTLVHEPLMQLIGAHSKSPLAWLISTFATASVHLRDQKTAPRCGLELAHRQSVDMFTELIAIGGNSIDCMVEDVERIPPFLHLLEFRVTILVVLGAGWFFDSCGV